MKLISENDINTAVNRMGSFGANPMEAILTRMRDEQEELLRYLVEVDADEFNEDERDLLVAVSATAWFIMKETFGAVPSKSGVFLDFLLERNLDRYEELGEEEETADSFFDELITGEAEQPILIGFLSGLLLDRPEDYSGEIRDEHLPAIILHVKTAVDALALDEEEWMPDEAVGEYSEEAFEEAGRILAGMLDEYEKSPLFEALGEDERANSRMIVTAFGELMYNYFLLMPADWTAQRAIEVCVEIMPRKLAAPESFFAAMYPVLISFMEFAGQKGTVPRAERILSRLSGMLGKH